MRKSEIGRSSATVVSNVVQKGDLTCSLLVKTQRYFILLEELLCFIATKAVPRLLMLLSLLVSSTAFADNSTATPPLSFSEAYQLARENNPELAMAAYKVDGVQAERDVARGRFFPQVSLFGDWSENKVRYESSALSQLPSQNYPGERYGLQLRSPLLNVSAYREYERQAALVDQSQQELEVAESQLLLLAVELYLKLLLAQEDLLQLESELTSLDRQLDEANALFERSLLPITHVLETQTRVDILGADVINAKGNVALAKQQLDQLVGLNSVELLQIADRIPLMSSFGDANDAASAALQFDAATAVAQEAVNAAKKAVEREKGTWWPEIDFVYTSQYSDVGFDNLTSPPRTSESYAISMRYPLFEGGAGAARIRGAWAGYYSAQQNLELVKRDTEGRARSAWLSLEVATKRVQASRQAVKTAETNLQASRKAVKAGTARITDVLMALAQLTRAKRNLSEARFLRAMGWVELQLVTGSDPIGLASTLSVALHGR